MVERFVFTLPRQRQIAEGGLPLMRSLCRGTAAVGRGGESSSALCMGKGGSSRSSPPLTGTGCAGLEAVGRALNHSSSHWCSPWPSRPWPFGSGHSHCHRHPCYRVLWEVQSGGSCKACSCGREIFGKSVSKWTEHFGWCIHEQERQVGQGEKRQESASLLQTHSIKPPWHSGLVNSPGESPALHSIGQITGIGEQNTSYQLLTDNSFPKLR